MAHMVGADPAQLDALGARMAAAAERLESIRTGIGALLAHSHWDGRDADDFRHVWHHQLAPRLHNAAVMTRAGAATVRANAQQQRDASSPGGSSGGGHLGYGSSSPAAVADPIKTFLDAKGGFDTLLVALGGVGYLAGSLSDVAASKIPFLRALAPAVRDLPRGVQAILVNDLTATGGLAKGVGIAGEFAGAALSGVFLGLDAMEFGYGLATDPGSPDTYNSGADLLFGIAGVAAIGCPPAALIIGGAGIAYSIATMINPDLTKDIVHGVDDTARAVWDGAGELVEMHRQVTHVAVDAAQDVISGGVNAVKNMFSF